MRPNIIFYFSDQQRADTVNEAVTPNLMKMASEGTIFENSFTCQPVCGPARACLQTGLYATQNKSYFNGIPLSDEIKPLAEYFNEAGYETAYVGKWHLASGRSKNGIYHHEKTAVPENLRGGYKDYWMASDVLEFTSHGYDGFVFDKDNNKVEFKGYRADCINDFALDYLDKKTSDKPFFMFISQLEPHHQNDHHCYEGPKETVEKFKDYPLPDDLTFLQGDYEKMYPDYMAAINRLDENVGKLVKKLKEKGIYDNTVIIYTSDHGSHFKTRNAEYKRSCHESSIHTPLIITGGAFKNGGAEDRLVSLIDLPPTLLDIAGIEIPKSYIGKSLKKQIESEDKKERDCVFIQISESQCGRAIRTKKYKYSVRAATPTGYVLHSSPIYFEDYLYDLENDSIEKNNLIKEKNYASVRKELKAMLVREMVNAGEKKPIILPAVVAKSK